MIFIFRWYLQSETGGPGALKLQGDVSHTVAPRSQVLTPRDQVFTGEVNIIDYAY